MDNKNIKQIIDVSGLVKTIIQIGKVEGGVNLNLHPTEFLSDKDHLSSFLSALQLQVAPPPRVEDQGCSVLDTSGL
jgi:hypothetical protein